MYESLVLMPLETTDGKPVLACYICCAKLKNCFELRKSCLQSEELFTQMLSSNESEQVKLQGINNKKKLTMDNVVHLSIGHELAMSADNVGVEALKFEVKLEPNDGEASEEDFIIIVKEEQTGDRTGDPTPKESTLDDPRNPEDVTTSNLKHRELVQDTLQAVHKLTAVASTNEVTFTLADDNKERPTSVPRSARVQYTCGTCQQCYSSKCEFERHVRVCSAVWKKDRSRKSITSTHTDTAHKLHQCLVCNKNFVRIDSLNCHMRTHSGEKPYQCDLCKKQFSRKSSLIRHMGTHTGEKPYQCDICKKQFSLKGNLRQHMRTHTGEKPYHCGLCTKQFSSKKYLIKHIPTHTGEEPYQSDILCNTQSRQNRYTYTREKPFHCEICKKQYTVRKNVMKHMRTHTGEKPHQCNICTRSFSHLCHLRRHMATHTGEKPHQCNICTRSFSHLCYLRRHMATHTGEKPHQCNICTRSFSHLCYLRRHMATHTGEKPHQCNICTRSFTHLCHLRRHMATHTDKKLV